MPNSPDPFDEFLRLLAPLMQSRREPSNPASLPIYRSVYVVAVAVRQGKEWILVSGEAVISTDDFEPKRRLCKSAELPDLFAFRGEIPIKKLAGLLDDLRASWFLRQENVRLTREKLNGYVWTLPETVGLVEGDGGRSLKMIGRGPDLSTLLSYSTWQRIENQLRHSTPVLGFNGFDGLCAALNLSTRRSKLEASFRLVAELPGVIREVNIYPRKEVIKVSYVHLGKAEIAVEYLPLHPMLTIPFKAKVTKTCRGEPGTGGCFSETLLPIPKGGIPAALLTLFLGEMKSDVVLIDLKRYMDEQKVAGPIQVKLERENLDQFEELMEQQPADSATREARSEQKRPKLPRYRSKLKITIFMYLMRHPKAANIEICEGLDEDGAAPAEGYKEDPEGSFYQKAYKGTDEDLKQYIQNSIDEVQADFRLLGWQL